MKTTSKKPPDNQLPRSKHYFGQISSNLCLARSTFRNFIVTLGIISPSVIIQVFQASLLSFRGTINHLAFSTVPQQVMSSNRLGLPTLPMSSAHCCASCGHFQDSLSWSSVPPPSIIHSPALNSIGVRFVAVLTRQNALSSRVQPQVTIILVLYYREMFGRNALFSKVCLFTILRALSSSRMRLSVIFCQSYALWFESASSPSSTSLQVALPGNAPSATYQYQAAQVHIPVPWTVTSAHYRHRLGYHSLQPLNQSLDNESSIKSLH